MYAPAMETMRMRELFIMIMALQPVLLPAVWDKVVLMGEAGM
jgi:hypothetical protein